MNTPTLYAALIGGAMLTGNLIAHAELARYESSAYPPITFSDGAPARNCEIRQQWEDGSARARCEVGTLGPPQQYMYWVYDPDGSAYRDPLTGAIERDLSTIGWHMEEVK
jgi:hypothetical protein